MRKNRIGQYFPLLDLIRVAALIGVMICHSILLAPFSFNAAIILREIGFVAVESFFVLSGFLVVVRAIQFEGNFISFLKKSWAFLFLPLWIAVLLYSLFWIYQDYSFPANYPFYFLALPNIALPIDRFMIFTWPLSIIFWSYLLHYLIAILVRKNLRLIAILICVVFILVGILIRIILLPDFIPNWAQNIHEVMIYRLDAVFYGALLAIIYHTRKNIFENKYFRILSFWLAIFLFALAIFLIGQDLTFKPQIINLVLILFPLAYCFLVAAWVARKKEIFVGNLIKYIAQNSYFIYLIHMLVFYSLMEFFANSYLLLASGLIISTTLGSIFGNIFYLCKNKS